MWPATPIMLSGRAHIVGFNIFRVVLPRAVVSVLLYFDRFKMGVRWLFGLLTTCRDTYLGGMVRQCSASYRWKVKHPSFGFRRAGLANVYALLFDTMVWFYSLRPR